MLAYRLLGEYFELESKRAVIRAELPPERLQEHDEFVELDAQATTLRERTERLLPDVGNLIESFADIDREGY